jgi:hypothetical protein
MDRKKYRAVLDAFTKSSDSLNKTQNVPDKFHSPLQNSPLLHKHNDSKHMSIFVSIPCKYGSAALLPLLVLPPPIEPDILSH